VKPLSTNAPSKVVSPVQPLFCWTKTPALVVMVTTLLSRSFPWKAFQLKNVNSVDHCPLAHLMACVVPKFPEIDEVPKSKSSSAATRASLRSLNPDVASGRTTGHKPGSLS
jgi:hypothetical protein